jgi:hypothetical protein
LTAARAAAAAVVLALATPAGAAPEGRAWWLPDHVKGQTAGNLGVVAGGVGYAWHGRRLEADLLVGWVPESVAGRHLVPVSAKVTWQPLRWEREGWLLRPLAGAQLTYTPGDEFFVLLPERYPDDYYQVPTALRAGVVLGGSLSRRVRGTFSELGVFWELVALDVALADWVRNPRTVGPTDVFSLALGLRAAL